MESLATPTANSTSMKEVLIKRKARMRRCLSDRATREARDATRRRAASREATTEAGRRASRASRRPAGPPRRRRRRVAGPRVARRERPLLASARASRRHAQENAEGSRRAAGPTNASPSKRANDAPTSPRDVEPALWRPRMARDTGAGRSGGCPVTARGHTHQPAVFPKSASARRWASREIIFPRVWIGDALPRCLLVHGKQSGKSAGLPFSADSGQTDPGLARRFARVFLSALSPRRSNWKRWRGEPRVRADDDANHRCGPGVNARVRRLRVSERFRRLSPTRTPQGDPPLLGIG